MYHRNTAETLDVPGVLEVVVGQPRGAEVYIALAIILPPVLGILWSVKEWYAVAMIDISAQDDLEGDRKEGIVQQMKMLSTAIQDGAMAFLTAEYRYLSIYILCFTFLLFAVTGDKQWVDGAVTSLAFVVGAITSMLCGWIGMRIAVFTNVRTAFQCWKSLEAGFDVAIQGGSIMGLSLVSLGVLVLYTLIQVVQVLVGPDANVKTTFHCITGYGLGGSSIALFARVGGGIYTKAADVGADLAGKNEWGLDEDDPRNPAVIADLVGDNVGDIAGMGADLFGSFAEATCAAMLLVASQDALSNSTAALMYPLLLSSAGILGGLLALLLRGVFFKVREEEDVERALKGLLLISTTLMSPAAWTLSWACLPAEFSLGEHHPHVQWWYCAVSVVLGLWSGLLIGYVTEFYTSSSFSPVREIAETQKQSAATGVIYGLALGYLSTIVPTLCLGVTILVSHTLCGFFGVALGALGMLGTMSMSLTIDAYGPISDNAGGIAEMSGMPVVVRERTDCLDAAGNTTAAVGKGFAIGSAALVSLALFGAFASVAEVGGASASILDPWIFMGLLFGAMMPYAFAAWTMKSVGMAANDMVKECMAQFPRIMGEERASPDYDRCIRISTEASLREMIAPSALVILSPLVAGFVFGRNACAGLLLGALVSSIQLAISMSNSGGAWDNAKKYITSGGLGSEFGKGSEAHKNSVTGDTVGDPLKDTSGPALNIVMKLTAIISLVFASQIAQFSNPAGGPIWLSP